MAARDQQIMALELLVKGKHDTAAGKAELVQKHEAQIATLQQKLVEAAEHIATLQSKVQDRHGPLAFYSVNFLQADRGGVRSARTHTRTDRHAEPRKVVLGV